ncbi:MAG: TonB-dependent receptor [Bacteroidales bacterium]|nr:TonB-dependent receptor [Bacteroidales bacterium]
MKYYIFFCLLAISSALSGQTVISGTVRAIKDGTLPGANIYLKGTYDGTSSNAEGQFSFTTRKTGTYTLMVEFMGYEPFSQEITLEGKAIQLNVEMKETFNKLEAVNITAGTFEAGDRKQANTISSLDMITTAGAAGDVFGALQSLPGTTTIGESGRLFVKGGDSEESQTYIDGALVHTPYNSSAPNTATRGRFNPFMFKGTIFSTGGYSAEYGQALSSVLLLNTNDMPAQDQLDISLLSVGPEIAATKCWKSGAVTATLTYNNLRPYMDLVPQNYEWKKAPESGTGAISIRQKTGKTGMLKVYGSFDRGSFTLAQQDLDQDKMIDFSLGNRNTFINSSFISSLGKGWSTTAAASFTTDHDDVEFDGTRFKKELTGFHLKNTISREVSQKITVRAGAEWFSRSVEQTFSSQADTFLNQYSNNTIAAFTEAEMYASKKFVTRIGARVENSSYLKRANFAPRITAAWKLNETSQFSMAYGWFYQNPSDDFLVYTNQLGYERADHYTFSYQSSTNGRTLRAEIYYKDYRNLVKQMTGDFYLPESYNNQGSGYATGFDLFWRDKKSIKHGDYWISYSFLDTKRNYRNYPEMSIPGFASTHNLAVVYKHWFGKLRSLAGVNYKYSSPRVYNDPNSEEFNSKKTLAYQSLDVSWSFLYRPNIIFYGAITNVPGFKQEFGRRFSDQADENGIYRSAAVTPGSNRFYVVAILITLTKKGTENQLDKIQ